MKFEGFFATVFGRPSHVKHAAVVELRRAFDANNRAATQLQEAIDARTQRNNPTRESYRIGHNPDKVNPWDT